MSQITPLENFIAQIGAKSGSDTIINIILSVYTNLNE